MDILQYSRDSNQFPQIHAQGVNEALYKALYLLSSQKEIPSRDGTTREVMNCRFIIDNPRDRFIRLEGRKHNVFSQIGETLWVLAGTNKLKYLSLFLPRAEQFSDDGGDTWRSGYGKRLRNYPVYQRDDTSWMQTSVDQLQQVINKLSDSPETRRAFIVLTYPPVDHSPGIDVVCNVALHFLIRDGRLHMTIHNRSNDAIWGFSGINFFEFTALQEVIVNILQEEYNMDVKVGSFVHNSMSYHVYSRHYERMRGIMKKNGLIPGFEEEKFYPFSVGRLDSMDNILESWLNFLDDFPWTVLQIDSNDFARGLDIFLKEALRVHSPGTIPIYAAACLVYLAKKYDLLNRGIQEPYGIFYDAYNASCYRLDIDPENTYFIEQVNKKLLD